MVFTSNKILVTGAAGFIGFHLCKRLLSEGYSVVGLDNVNDYYDVDLKEDRIRHLEKFEHFRFKRQDLQDREKMSGLFEEYKFEYVVNLAAQAGVRHSISHPFDYIETNVTGFLNVLERCKDHQVKHLVFASSSSVYGANTSMPFSVKHETNHPISLYAATKKSNELLAHSYAYTYNLPVTGLRFFSVYGPWGRPDMALFIFTKNIAEGLPIDVFNEGLMQRDFTYIDDIVEGIRRVIPKVSEPDKSWQSDNPVPDSSFVPYRLFNIGNNAPIALIEFIEAIEKNLDRKSIRNLLPMQTGDIPNSTADASELFEYVGYEPKTTVEQGISNFVSWYKSYYKI